MTQPLPGGSSTTLPWPKDQLHLDHPLAGWGPPNRAVRDPPCAHVPPEASAQALVGGALRVGPGAVVEPLTLRRRTLGVGRRRGARTEEGATRAPTVLAIHPSWWRRRDPPAREHRWGRAAGHREAPASWRRRLSGGCSAAAQRCERAASCIQLPHCRSPCLTGLTTVADIASVLPLTGGPGSVPVTPSVPCPAAVGGGARRRSPIWAVCVAALGAPPRTVRGRPAVPRARRCSPRRPAAAASRSTGAPSTWAAGGAPTASPP